MTKDKTPPAAALRLQSLSGQLKKAYQRAGDHIADSLMPIEEAVAEIDEPWLPKHFAEALKTDGPAKAHRPRSCFATETFANGDKADYLLCVARRHNRRCGLHVSYCQYAVKPVKDAGGRNRPDVAIRESFVVLPDKLPVPMRLRILDILDAFSEEYEAHVRKSRGDILDRFAQDSPFEGAAFAPPDAATKGAESACSHPLESSTPTASDEGRTWRPNLIGGEPDQASGEPGQEDETVLEETKAADEEEVRDDVPDPLTKSAPRGERPSIETDHEKAALAPEMDDPRTAIELKNHEEEPKAEVKKRTRLHGTRSARLEEAESNIPLQAWV